MNDAAWGRAMDSLEGLSCGDGFGECFFSTVRRYQAVPTRELPPGTWTVTDDTMMAISVMEVLRVHGEIAEERLAEHFAALYDPGRGYGAAMHGLLGRIGRLGGGVWREEAKALFGGRGSFGNGAAMRVAPLGAYFADDLGMVVEQARRSAWTTHAHSEAAAGAIAIAIGAALAWRGRDEPVPEVREFLGSVLEWMPAGEVRFGIERAAALPGDTTPQTAASVLGNGAQMSVVDTVPFTLWCAGGFLASYEDALWATVSVGGDMDTTCAIVGGIVGARVGVAGVPEDWRQRREPILPLFVAGR